MTINQLKQLFSSIGEAHYFIKTSEFGDPPIKVEANTEATYYPAFYQVLNDSVNREQTVERNFTLIICDLVYPDKSNLDEVLSDTERTLGDVIKIMRQQSEYYSVIGDPQLIDFKDRYGDAVAGWQCDIVIETDNNSSFCDIPADLFGYDGFTGEDGLPLDIGPFKCSDLMICDSFTGALSDIEILERTRYADTGVIEYEGATYNSPTTINIGVVKGYIVDNETNPVIPTHTYVEYAGDTNILVPTIGSGIATYVLIDSNSQIVFQNTFPTSAQRKSMIWLSKVAHPNQTTIGLVIDEPDFILSPTAQLRDLFQSLGYVNDGVYVSPNGNNLNINLSSGDIHGSGINFTTDKTNPDEHSVSGTSSVPFVYRNQNGGTSSFVITIDPTTYDNGGTTTTITGGTNLSTIQHIFYVPSGGIVIQRGQTIYNTLALALTAVDNEDFIVYPNLIENAICIGVIVLRHTTTNLSNTNFARILRADKLGQLLGAVGGASTGTLQTAYNNSGEPEILTDSIHGAVSIRRGSGADSDIIFSGQSGTGSNVFSITGEGTTTIKTLVNPEQRVLFSTTSGVISSSGDFLFEGMSATQGGLVVGNPSWIKSYFSINASEGIATEGSSYLYRVGDTSAFFYTTIRGAGDASNFGNPIGNGAVEFATNNTAGIVFGAMSAGSQMALCTEGTEKINIASNGNVRVNNLSGTGSRMVVADASGILSTQTIPTGGGGGTVSIPSTHIPFGDVSNSLTSSSTLTYLSETLKLVGNGGSTTLSIGSENGWAITAPQGLTIFSPSGYFNHNAVAHNFYNGNVGIGTTFNTNPSHKLVVQGDVKITNQSGTGSRFVEADSNGVQSATKITIDAWITDATIRTELEDTTNWDLSGQWIGTIAGAYQGQQHYNNNYHFVLVEDDEPIRNIRG